MTPLLDSSILREQLSSSETEKGETATITGCEHEEATNYLLLLLIADGFYSLAMAYRNWTVCSLQALIRPSSFEQVFMT